MSNFNPKGKHRSPEEWQEYIADKSGDGDSNFLVGAALAMGLLLSATVSPATGICAGLLLFYKAFRNTQGINRREEAILEYGCVAPFLEGNDFKDFLAQAGAEEVVRQLEWAIARGYDLTDDAQNLLAKYKPLQHSEPLGQRVLSAVGATKSLVNNAFSQVYPVPVPEKEHNLVEAMSDRIKNHLIVALPGAGKGIVVSNALEAIKNKHPHVITFYIDPKGDEREFGYFKDGRIKILKQIKALTKSPSTVVEWFKAAIKEFQALPAPKLLILDEATYITNTLKNAKEGAWLKSVIVSFTSMGDSQGVHIWLICQNPHTDDLGLNSGGRSQLNALAIVPQQGMSSYKSIASCKWLPVTPKDEEIMQISDSSPVGRAYYYEGNREWIPLPRLPNFSGYDRDSRVIQPEAPQDAPTEIPSGVEEEPIDPQFLDQVVHIVRSASKLPISFDSIRNSRHWEEKPSRPQLKGALNILVASERLQGDYEKGYSPIGV